MLALALLLRGGGRAVLDAFISLAAFAGWREGGGAVLNGFLLPMGDEGGGMPYGPPRSGAGLVSGRCGRGVATSSGAAECWRCSSGESSSGESLAAFPNGGKLQSTLNHYNGNTDDFATRVANLMSGNGVPLLDATTVTGNTIIGNGELALIYSDGNDSINGFDPNSQAVPIMP